MATQFRSPGDRLTFKNRFARMLLDQAPDVGQIRSHGQGVNYLANQGLAGFLMGADRRDQEAADAAFASALNPSVGAPPGSPAAGAVAARGGPPPSLRERLQGALTGMQGNPHATRLQRMLMGSQIANEQRVADERRQTEAMKALKLWEWQNKPEAPRAPITLGANQQAYDPATGSLIASGPGKPAADSAQVKNYKFAKSKGFAGTFQDWVMAANLARGGVMFHPEEIAGSGPTTAGGATLVPGSPAAIAADKAAQKKLALEEKARKRKENVARAGGTVIQDLGRAIHIAETDWKASGPFAILWSKVPGTDAFTASGHIQSALSNVGLDTLQAMREASPTGGALGQVPVQQQKRLEQVLGSLDQAQPKEVLLDNLRRVQNTYLDIVYGTPEEIAALVQKGKISEAEAQRISARHRLSFDDFGRPIQGTGRFPRYRPNAGPGPQTMGQTNDDPATLKRELGIPEMQ